jgi:hypothetical protein
VAVVDDPACSASQGVERMDMADPETMPVIVRIMGRYCLFYKRRVFAYRSAVLSLIAWVRVVYRQNGMWERSDISDIVTGVFPPGGSTVEPREEEEAPFNHEPEPEPRPGPRPRPRWV